MGKKEVPVKHVATLLKTTSIIALIFDMDVFIRWLRNVVTPHAFVTRIPRSLE